MKVITEYDVSTAWSKIFVPMVRGVGDVTSPLVVEILLDDNESSVEIPLVRQALDSTLDALGLQAVQTVANTIFPENLWRLAKGDRQRLFQHYKRNLPRYRKLEPFLNHRGLYFERLISYDGFNDFNGNQLEYIISSFKHNGGSRRSKFQASIFDPRKDHIASARLIFPCLQHVSFLPFPKTGELKMNAFYATQLLLSKAYGNFLGLIRLGRFMADEMGLTLTGVTIMIGREKLGQPKAQLRPLVGELEKLVAGL